MATYSFTTTVSMPVSADWPCMDIGGAQMGNILLLSDVTASRGSPWLTLDGNNDLVLMSDDSIATILTMSLPIGQKFTFETTFKPTSLPTNLDDLTQSRFFIAVFDAQDNAGGILISQAGLAIVSSFGNTVMPIAGSQNIILEGDDYYTLRMVVDGENNVMDLYVTKSDEVDVTGHQLRYTTAAPITPAGTPDSARIEILGNAGSTTLIKFDELRCNCLELVVPNQKPIADTGRDQTAVLGSIIALDGTASYDPEGEPLTYRWTLFAAPDGSSYRQSGSGGFTVDDLDGDDFTAWFEETGEPWSVDNSPSLQPGDILVVGDSQYIVDDTDWTLNATTGKYERGGGWDNNKLRVTLDALPINLSDQTWDLYFSDTFYNDPTAPSPTAIPDVEGLYGLQLVVNDGSLDSLPAQGLTNIAPSNVAFGYVPDVNFIWDYLSDAWNLFDDRDPITTMWSGFAQVASNILLTAWQLDYAKSLVDIQRQFQRRWLDYRTLYTEPQEDRDDITLTIVRGTVVKDIDGGKTFASDETLLISKDGGDEVTVTLSGAMTAQEIVDKINLDLGEEAAYSKTASLVNSGGVDYLVLSYSGLLVVSKDGTANGTMGFDTENDTQNSLSGTDGESDPVHDPSNPQLTAFKASDPLVDFSSFASKNSVLSFDGAGYEIKKVAGTDQLTASQDLTEGIGKSWEVCSTVEAVNSDFTDRLVTVGDILILEVRASAADPSTKVLCEVLGVRNKKIGFDARPLFEATGGSISSYDVALHGVQRVSSIPVNELVERIPRLQEIILDPPEFLSENRDYTISTNSDGVRGIHFREDLYSFDDPPPDILWAEQTFLDNKPMIEDNYGKPIGFLIEHMEESSDDLDYLSAVRGLWYAFFNGPSLWSVRVGIQILLGLPFAEVDGVVTDINETYNANYIRMLIQDSADDAVVRSYFIPRNANFEEDGVSMIADNPSTGEPYQVGDTVDQFSPLSQGVELLDWINDPDWWLGYHGQGVFLEVDKFFRFLVRADIDVFSIANLVLAIDFVKKIKPSYTFPMWVVFKRVPGDTISVTDPDILEKLGTLYLYDHPACAKQITDQGSGGAYRFDDTDESGNYNWAFDGVPHGGSAKPEFLYDKKALCPDMEITGILSAYWAGGVFPFDWLWAFDDGGGGDVVPLSGPLGSPPPSGGPYGTPVGTIQFDTPYSAGWYTRGKVL